MEIATSYLGRGLRGIETLPRDGIYRWRQILARGDRAGSCAMFIAGVPTLVVSQWKVDSAGTRDLMVNFHRALMPRRKAERRGLFVRPL